MTSKVSQKDFVKFFVFLFLAQGFNVGIELAFLNCIIVSLQPLFFQWDKCSYNGKKVKIFLF